MFGEEYKLRSSSLCN